MDDMTAFERQLASEVAEMAGPEPRFDAMAIVHRAATPSSRSTIGSMFSATKFVVAGAIVALFGGMLLAGVQTQPSDDRPPAVGASGTPQAQSTDDTTTMPDLLPGVDLVTEEVEPGVYRIIDDGHRVLSRPVEGEGRDSTARRTNLTVGQDGSVWIFGPEHFFRLGDPRSHASDEGTPAYSDSSMGWVGQKVEVGPDGVIWARDRLPDAPDLDRKSAPGPALRSFDGTTWEVRLDDVAAFDLAPDGTVWAFAGGSFQRLGADGWSAVGPAGYGGSGYVGSRRFWVSPLIHEHFLEGSMEPDPEFEILNWPDRCEPGEPCGPVINLYGDRMDSMGSGGLVETIRLVDMGNDGDHWVLQSLEVPQAESTAHGGFDVRVISYLVHVEDGESNVYTSDEGVPEMARFYEAPTDLMRAGPGGSVWLTLGFERDLGREPGYVSGDGVVRFDGQTWTYFLRDTCVYALDVGPDGTAWVQGGTCDASGMGPVETYAITPEAVAVAP